MERTWWADSHTTHSTLKNLGFALLIAYRSAAFLVGETARHALALLAPTPATPPPLVPRYAPCFLHNRDAVPPARASSVSVPADRSASFLVGKELPVPPVDAVWCLFVFRCETVLSRAPPFVSHSVWSRSNSATVETETTVSHKTQVNLLIKILEISKNIIYAHRYNYNSGHPPVRGQTFDAVFRGRKYSHPVAHICVKSLPNLQHKTANRGCKYWMTLSGFNTQDNIQPLENGCPEAPVQWC